jgi:hypothetical protein
MLGETDIKPVTLYATGDSTAGMAFPNWNTVTGTFDINHGALLTPAVKFTTNVTTGGGAVGRSAPLLAGRVVFPNDIFVGRSLTTARFISFEAATPFVGPEYAKGDIVFNSNPVSAGNVGWICTQGGVVSTTPAWVTSTNYALNQHVQNGGNFYRCTYDPGVTASVVEPVHLSGTVTVADGSQWEFLTKPATASHWVTGTSYAVGDIVKNIGGDCHRVLIAGSGASTFEPVHVYVHKTRTYSDGYKWEYLCSDYTSPLWVFGKIYAIYPGSTVEASTVVLNSSGNGYRIVALNLTTRLSTDPPVHTSGEVLAADWHRWLYIANTSPVWKTWGTVS